MYDSMMIHRELVADTCLWMVSVYEYLSMSICLSVGISVSVLCPKGGILQEMFNVLVDSIKTSTEVQKQFAQSNYELMKNCNQMLTSATNMMNVVVNKFDASNSKKASGSAAGASKKAAGAQRGKRKVIVMLDGEEKEVLLITYC